MAKRFSLIVVRDLSDRDYGSVLFLTLAQETGVVIPFLLGVVNERVTHARWLPDKAIRIEEDGGFKLTSKTQDLFKRSAIDLMVNDLSHIQVVTRIADEVFKHPTPKKPPRDETIRKAVNDMINVFKISDDTLPKMKGAKK